MSDALVFADRVRAALTVARRFGLEIPAFRSPPKDPAVTRSLRYHDDGSAVIAIRIAGRTVDEMEADIVDGILAANGCDPDASEFRAACAEAFDVF